jgi:ApaG protein
MKNNFNIRIKVTTNYLKEQSAPDENRYVFSYTINIKNLGNDSAKLISRQWIITDSNGNIQEVNGDGVVGQQPNINPGEEFTYTSGTIIKTPVGTMEGRYFMEDINNKRFEALIAPFTLAVPGLIN